MSNSQARRVAVIGASGAVGRRIVDRLVDRGFDVVCQTRSAEKLSGLARRAEVRVFDPRNAGSMAEFVEGVDAVIYALGIDRAGATTLFSDSTHGLIQAMRSHGVRRLIAITGVGAGETRGHGGFVYDRIIFPLFTRKRYEDKDRQEAIIAASDLDWTIVRPAPFTERAAPGPIEVVIRIEPGKRLTRITRDEVADFVVAELASGRYVRQRPFIGHT